MHRARSAPFRLTRSAAAACLLLTLAGCSAQPISTSREIQSAADASDIVSVHLTDFAFSPGTVQLHAGVPVRLRLVNDSSGGHDFSAPAFFAASSFPAGQVPPSNGKVDVAPQQTVDVALVPRTSGTYPVECTHFLHAVFGMTGKIDVVP